MIHRACWRWRSGPSSDQAVVHSSLFWSGGKAASDDFLDLQKSRACLSHLGNSLGVLSAANLKARVGTSGVVLSVRGGGWSDRPRP